MRRILLALGMLVFMTGSAHALDLKKVCGDFAALENPDTKVYRGEWKRTYPNESNSAETAFAVIETTKSGRLLLLYAFRFWNGRAERCHALFGSMAGQTLQAITPWRRTTLEYTLDGEGGATAKYTRKDKGGTVNLQTEGRLQLEK